LYNATMSKLSEASALTLDDPDNPEQADDISESDSVRIGRMRKRIEALLNPDDLATQLYRDRKLNRDEWYAKHADLSFQLLMRSLIREGVNGDGKCADLAIRELKAWFDKTRSGKVDTQGERETQVQSQLMQRPRAPQDVGSE